MFDLCHDFSFWQAETGRCIPKDMLVHPNVSTWPPLCKRASFDCTMGFFKEYCPNTSDRETCLMYEEDEKFFCEESKTCISRGK